MPAVLTTFVERYAGLLHTRALPRVKPTWVAGVALAVFVIAGWRVVGNRIATAQTKVAELYPHTPVPVMMIDAKQYTVAQVVSALPVALRFEMLLKRTGVMQELAGEGPYTVLVPEGNYFDYVSGGLPSYTRADEKALAERHVLPHVAVVPTAASDGLYVTVGGEQLPVTVNADGTVDVANGFAVRGYYAQNGVVYLISKVLVPDSAPTP